MTTDTAAELSVFAANDLSDERTVRVVSTAANQGKRFVEVGLTLAARRELIEALGGVVGPDWGED